MPWAIDDVERHKKGLTDEQKRQWVAVANSALARCLEQGRDQKTCEASAIRQANAVVDRSPARHHIQHNRYTLRRERLEGRTYIVVPVVMLREGVHNGSAGPILHTSEEMAKVPAAWNGIPVTIGHPEQQGKPVSANQPPVLEAQVVGRVFHARYEDGALKAEAWLDERKLRKLSPLAHAYISQQRPLDVSVGVFSEDDYSNTGDWNGEEYIGVARNYRPDHLALLPGGKGACSWEDGCGVRTNEQGGVEKMKDKIKQLLEMAPSVYSDEDMEWLSGLEEPQVDKLLTCAATAQAQAEEAAQARAKVEALEVKINELKEQMTNKGDGGQVNINKEQALQVLKEQLSDKEIMAELLSNELKQQIAYAQRLRDEHRKQQIEHILANQAAKVWDEESLQELSDEHLERLAKSIKAPADYSVSGLEPRRAEQPAAYGELLLPLGVELG